MTWFDDSAERLRAANPLPLEDAPGPNSPQALDLFGQILATSPQTNAPKRRRPRRWVLIIVPAAILAAAAAGYGLLRSVRDPLVVACFQSNSLAATQALVPGTSQDPALACRALWLPHGQFNASGVAAPPLSACVLETGGIGVFPSISGDDVCSALGLAPYEYAGSEKENNAIHELQEALSTEFVHRCVSGDEALIIAKRLVIHAGLRGWSIQSNVPYTLQEPCASAAFDVPRRTIRLIPVSDPSS